MTNEQLTSLAVFVQPHLKAALSMTLGLVIHLGSTELFLSPIYSFSSSSPSPAVNKNIYKYICSYCCKHITKLFMMAHLIHKAQMEGLNPSPQFPFNEAAGGPQPICTKREHLPMLAIGAAAHSSS